MRFNRRFNKMVATTLSLLMLLVCPAFFPSSAEAGLFSKIKDTVKKHPVKSALAAVAVGAGAFLAAPYVASAVGAASGAIGAGGIGAAVSGIGAGIAGVGSAIWGGLVAAGGFVTGALGAIGGAIGGLFSGIAGFITGIVGSPLFIPALVVIGAAVIGYILWKKYKRQPQAIGNGSNLPTVGNQAATPITEITVAPSQTPVTAGEIPPSSSTPASTEVPVAGDTTMNSGAGQVAESTPAVAGDALKNAHADYIKAYNEYISKVTNIGGSENPDEELRNNMRRDDAQKSLNAYRDAYNRYITLLRQSNAK
jgi:hypothetical protein